MKMWRSLIKDIKNLTEDEKNTLRKIIRLKRKKASDTKFIEYYENNKETVTSLVNNRIAILDEDNIIRINTVLTDNEEICEAVLGN